MLLLAAPTATYVYIKCNKPHNIISGIINCQISDHLPVFAFAKTKINRKPEHSLKIKIKIKSIKNIFNEYEWNILYNMSGEEGYMHFIKSLTNIIAECVFEKEIIIKKKKYQRQMDDPWILIKSA